MLCILVAIFFIVDNQILAGEDLMPSADAMANAIQQAQQIQKDSKELLKKYPINPILNDLKSKKRCPSQPIGVGRKNANLGCKKNIDHNPPQLSKSSQILVFVSFSMPESSLKSLFKEAKDYNAVLIMRGLHEDSFVKTSQKLQKLGITVDINPDMFEKHHIKVVPTFISMRSGHPVCHLKGNVTLEFASQKFKDHLIEKKDISLKSKGTLCS